MKEFKSKPLIGLDDLSDDKYSLKELTRIENGKLTISTNASFEGRSKGGKTNKDSGHISNLGKKWGKITGKNNTILHSTKVLGAKAMAEKSSKIILQLSSDGKLIKEWVSMQEAGRNGFSVGAICNCCKNKLKQHKGFIWKYKDTI
jgi:hypothetical protein